MESFQEGIPAQEKLLQVMQANFLETGRLFRILFYSNPEFRFLLARGNSS
jgi:hypothetical protein